MTAPVIRVALPVPLFRQFDYTVPESLSVPAPGVRVGVPFGRRTLVGICLQINPVDTHDTLKPIQDVLDAEPLMSKADLAHAEWLADYYHHPIGEVLATMLPVEARKGRTARLPNADLWTLEDGVAWDSTLARAPRQRALAQWLSGHGVSSGEQITAAGFDRSLLNTLTRRGIARALSDAEVAAEARTSVREQALTLTREQNEALVAISSRSGYHTVVLDGITGSGKTEVYLQAIDTVLGQGAQVLVLVPEIALTPQTVARFQARFDRVAALHSALSDLERWHTWLRCRSGAVDVLIGTRSAVFTPFPNLGLIIVDEEHDGSFKQHEGLRYSARDFTVKRAHSLEIPLVLGSATPSLETLHNVKLGRYQRCTLTHRPGQASLPAYQLLDIRGHTLVDGLAEPLLRQIGTHLSAGNQVLVFLNRRGFAPVMLCPDCGWQAVCTECDARLTVHRSPPHMRCHHCGHRTRIPPACPVCARPAPVMLGQGTQRTESGLQQRFPDTPLIRIDRDTTRSAHQLQRHLERIGEGQPALLVGTQMLAKGHHFPHVTLVAVVNADAGFFSADFRAPERTAALIVQVAGRAGRAEKPGHVVIQTLQPENTVLQTLISRGYGAFAEAELANRAAAGMPPARHMAMVRAEAESGELALEFLRQLRTLLAAFPSEALDVAGPVTAPVARIAARTRYQLMLLAPGRTVLHRACLMLREVNAPRQIRWSLDIDPLDSY